MKHVFISLTTVMASIGSIIVAVPNVQADMILIPWVGTTHLAGGESLSADIPRSTLTLNLTTGEGGGQRYVRLVLDLRDSNWSFPNIAVHSTVPDGNIYSPASGTDLFQASGTGGGWDGTLAGVTSVQFASGATSSYPKNPINGWTANDGSGMLGHVVNWIMLNSGDPAMPPGNSAVAIGFIWEDKDNTGKVSVGDQVILKYAITADSFAEMNTVEKLELFVIPEPATGMLLLMGGLAVCLAMRRRRR